MLNVTGRPQHRAGRPMSHQVEAYLFAKEASGRRPATLECYRARLSRLIAFLDDPPVAAIRASDLRRWLVALKLGRTRTTTGVYVEGHRGVAHGFFAWLVREGRLKRSPMHGVDQFLVDRTQVRTLTREEIQLLLDCQPNSRTGRRNRAMLAFMYDTGVRVAELARLRLQDVDVVAGLARIEGKTRSVDAIPLSRALCAELGSYLKESRFASQSFTGNAFFTSRSGGAASPNAIRLWLRRAKVRTGLHGKRVSPQVVRASAATHLAADGASAFGVQHFLRHTSVRMSQRYVDVAALDPERSHRSPFQSLVDEQAPRSVDPSALHAGVVTGVARRRASGWPPIFPRE
jgi:integrase/recombinase XerC